MSGSGISWAICKSAPRSRQITTPVPHAPSSVEHYSDDVSSTIYCSLFSVVQFSCEAACVASTFFGRELEISGFTWFDSRGLEFDQNHWLLTLHAPGSDVYDVPPPADAMKECPAICQNTCVTGSDEQPVKVPLTSHQAHLPQCQENPCVDDTDQQSAKFPVSDPHTDKDAGQYEC